MASVSVVMAANFSAMALGIFSGMLKESRVGAGIFTDQVVEIHPIYWRQLLEFSGGDRPEEETVELNRAEVRCSAKRATESLLKAVKY